MISARLLAYQILLHSHEKPAYPDRLIRAALARHSGLEDRDRALLTELVYGALRWQGRLDWHIDQLSKVKPAKIDPGVRILLRLALYQILFLNRIPAHAAVNETVKIAKANQPLHLVGFVNGLLREAIRRHPRWDWPSPEQDPEQFLAVTTAHPGWFVRDFLRQMGFDETKKLCEANNTIAPMVLRVNSSKTDPSQVLDWFEQHHIHAQPSLYLPNALKVSGLRQDLARLPCYEQGWVQVQDEASQLIATTLSPQPGERVLDLCAGFGGKTTHLGILMHDEGEILAVDHSAWKLEELQQNTGRQGIGIVRTLCADLLELSEEQLGLFDRVLLDAPCSGFGSLRRNPDIKWRRHAKDPFRFARLQKDLLQHAARFVRKGGVLVYATCTLFDEENEVVANHFSDSHPRYVVESVADALPASCQSMVQAPFFRSWPHRHGVDGFFAARWRRLD